MATSKEALELDGIPAGLEGKVDEAVKLLREAAADVLSAKAGARTPDEVPAPAPAAPAPDSMDVEAPQPAETPAAAPAADEEGSVAVGAPAPGLDVPAAAPAPAATASPSFAPGQRVVTIEEAGRTPRQGELITCSPEIREAWLAPSASGYKVHFQEDVHGGTLIAGFVDDRVQSIRSDCS